MDQKSMIFFRYRLSVDFLLESPQKLRKPCGAQKREREQWPPPGLTLKKQKNGPENFFSLVSIGGGGKWWRLCGADADAANISS